MRLWHYKLIPYLPNSQLLAQWRELNSIFKKQDKHILINYIYEYPKVDLLEYTLLVIYEMNKRNCKIKSFENAYMYFQELLCACIFKENYIPNEFIDGFKSERNLFTNHHTNGYLKQCFYNLQEKYDRGQKDFTGEMMVRLENFVKEELGKDVMPNGEL